MKYNIDFFISYAGEDREVADKLAALLNWRKAKVYYARYLKSELLGRDVKNEFKNAICDKTRFFIPLISRNYIHKDWPLYELIVAKNEETNRSEEFILPLRIDDSTTPHINPDIGYLSLEEETLETIVDILMAKITIEPSKSHLWCCTFGANIGDVLTHQDFPNDAPIHVPYLYDFLESDLMSRLQRGGLERFRTSEASQRTGETISVRIVFEWDSDKKPLTFGDLLWWEVLELDLAESFYPDISEDFL